MKRRCVWGLLLIGCTGGDDTGALDVGAARPDLSTFPSRALIDDDGHLALDRVDWPMVPGGTPAPIERLSSRTGFSPVQTAVVDLGVWLDASSLPAHGSSNTDDSVQLWNVSSGERIPALVELDAFPDNPDPAVLLVRPMVPMSSGSTAAVVLTEALRSSDSDQPLVVDWWQDAIGGNPHPDLAARAEEMVQLEAQLDGLGIGVRVLSFDFPIDDPTGPTRHMLDELEVPTEWAWSEIRDVDEGQDLAAGIWRRLHGSFTSETWLVDDGAFDIGADGLPASQGAGEVELWVYVPEALREAEAGSAPVWIFGHGIFADADHYLNSDTDESGVIELANRAGAVVLATEWRGLTADDRLVAVEVGNDFGRIPELTDKLAQGVVNNAALVELIESGGILDDPELGGVADPSQLFYYGISLGGIEGAALAAHTGAFDAAVFHVGGSAWSTMLERSSHWSLFETLLVDGIASPRDRQLLYALSQLFWDLADPANLADSLADQPVLWQESLYDEQVANLTTELLARGAGALVLEPIDELPMGLSGASAPLSGPAFARFDPETEVVHVENRPAETTGAHDAPRNWEGTKRQTLRFLDTEDPGVVEHYCGESLCSASNTGEDD